MMNVLNPFSFPQTFKDELSNNQDTITFTHNYSDKNNVKNNDNSESKNSGLRCEPKTQLTSPNQPTERILLTFNSKAFSVFRPIDGIPCILQDQYTSDLSIQLFMKALQNYFKLNNDVILYFPNINLKFRNYTHSIKTSLTQIIQFHKTDNVVLEIEEEANCFETLYSSIIDELFTEPHYEQNPENDEQNTALVEMNDDNDSYNDNASFAVFVSPKQSVHESENGSLANDPLHFDDYQLEFSEFSDISCDQSPSVSSAHHHLHHQSEFSNLGKREFGLCCASNDEDDLSSLKKQKFL